MFTPVSLRLFAGGLSLIATGMFFGNMILVYMGLVPIIYLLLGLILEQSKELSISISTETLSTWVDETLEVKRKFHVGEGFGPIIISEKIPDYFELVDGSNVRLFWKGFKNLDGEISYRIKCTRRGIYHLEDMEWEANNSFNITPPILGSSPIEQLLIVRPMPLNVKRIRQQRTFSKMIMPSDARIRMGIPTTDFKEIREYVFGDPYKHINWKASSRVAQRNKPPMVNSFEMEGMKVVWLFINTSARMALGTAIRNSFEYSVEAVLGLTQFYLSRNCRVGICIYNDEKSSSQEFQSMKYGEDDFLFPDIGKRQLHVINRKMLEAEVLGGVYNLKEAVNRCKGHIVGTNPLFVIITTINEDSYSSLLEGLTEIRKYVRLSRTTRPSILIIHIAGYSVVAQGERELYASKMIEIEEKSMLTNLSNMGALTVHWNPSAHTFSEVLLSQVTRR